MEANGVHFRSPHPFPALPIRPFVPTPISVNHYSRFFLSFQLFVNLDIFTVGPNISFNMDQTRHLFLFSSFWWCSDKYIVNYHYKWKKRCWCARDSNQGPPLDGRCRIFHWALGGPISISKQNFPTLYLVKSLSLVLPFLTFLFPSFLLSVCYSFYSSSLGVNPFPISVSSFPIAAASHHPSVHSSTFFYIRVTGLDVGVED